ncbi:MAG TPA: DUF1501 domain-containing protein [Pirellulaceae bacterium]|nr:DUF1501 domain-containing protein [Pirellulaceae bacterium]
MLAGRNPSKRARSAILIWLDGGPSHLETFDPKPLAPLEIRGPMQAIDTKLAGVQVNECMPSIAKRLDRLALIRNVTSGLGEHNLATQYLLTGYAPTPSLDYPVLGSLVSEVNGATTKLPPFVSIPNHRVGGVSFPPQGFLPRSNAPFETGGDPKVPDFQIESLKLYPGLNVERLQRRHAFLRHLDNLRQHADANRLARQHQVWHDVVELVASAEVREAFSLEQEDSRTRDAYGRTTVGQSCLLARRLVERGVSFVTVNFPGWDTHDRAVLRLKEGYTGAQTPVGLIPQLDNAVSGLVDDLHERGLLQETLVIVMGEFGRTPKVNSTGGRDHWPRAFSVLVAGGGTPQGTVIGDTDGHGREPLGHSVTPADLNATFLTLLGIDPDHELYTSDGRPIRISGGQAIRELM